MNIKVIVHYPPAKEPFKHEFAATQSVADVKSVVLKAFGLTEGQDAQGNTVMYPLYFEKRELTDPQEPIGKLAGEAEAINLKLTQHITQG